LSLRDYNVDEMRTDASSMHNKGLYHINHETETLSDYLPFTPNQSLISFWWKKVGWNSGSNPAGVFFQIDDFIRIGRETDQFIHVDIYDNGSWVDDVLVSTVPNIDSSGWQLINIYTSNTGDTAKAYLWVSSATNHSVASLVDTYTGSAFTFTDGNYLRVGTVSGENYTVYIDELYLFQNIDLDTASNRTSVMDALFNNKVGAFSTLYGTFATNWTNYYESLQSYTNKLTHAFHFEEAEGEDRLDEIGSLVLTDTNTDPMPRAVGVYNNGLYHLNYEDSTLADSMTFTPNQSLISFWWKKPSWVSGGNPGGQFFQIDNFIRIGRETDNYTHFDIYDNGGWVDDVLVTDFTNIGSTGWIHFCIYTSNTGDTAKAYLYATRSTDDGAYLSDTYTGTAFTFSTGTALQLGTISGENFTVSIDELYIYEDIDLDDAVNRYKVINGLFNKFYGSYYTADSRTANNTTLSAQDESMVAYWKGEDLADSKDSHTLTNNGSVTFTGGKYNNAFTLNGGNNCSAVASADWNQGTDDFTLSMWVKWNSVTTDTSILGMSATDNQFAWGHHAGAFRNGSGSGLWAFAPSTATWYHLVVSRRGNSLYCYIDGTEHGTVGDATGISFGRSDTTLQIGNCYSFANSLNGQIDEVTIWKGYGADQTFVDALYNSGTGAFKNFLWLLCFIPRRKRKREWKIINAELDKVA